jgi:ABC-type sugar transport system ATPase subunit
LLVSISDVSPSFGDVVALDDVSLDIHHNEFFALLGPSGCGKTTLLRILAGLEQPDSGTVTLDGADLLTIPPHRRPINLMFQSYALFPHLTSRRTSPTGSSARSGRRTRSASGSPRSSRPSASAGSASAARPSCRVASASAWRSPARS